MTVHAAKGLEFPVVVVADLWKMQKSSRGPDTFYREVSSSNGNREQVIDATYVIERDFVAAKAGRKSEEADEVKRLFYVAMTRARHHVSLMVADKDRKQPAGGPRTCRANSLPGRKRCC